MTAKKPKTKKRCWRGKPSPDGLSRKHEETVRKCIVTNETLPMNRMIRFCVSPDGLIVPDLAHKLPGRGIWVTADKEMIETACQKRLFIKYARRKIKWPEDMNELLANLFVKRLQELLGVAKKAGQVVSGFEKAEEALRKGPVACLLEATDAASDGREKLSRLCAAGNIPVLRILTADQTAQALGSGMGVHIVLKSGGVSDLIVAEAQRFAAYCKIEPFKV